MTKIGELNDYDREVIKRLWRQSTPPEKLARQWQCDVELIWDLIGAPKDKKARIAFQKDNCYFDHGMGDMENHQEIRMEFYGEFLDDGDFERYQPCCYMSWYNPYKIVMFARAKMIRKTTNPHREVRRLWILNRFTMFQSAAWKAIDDQEVAYLIAAAPRHMVQFPK